MLKIVIIDSLYLFNEFLTLFYINNFDKFVDKVEGRLFIGKLPNKQLLSQQMQATIYNLLLQYNNNSCLNIEILLNQQFNLDDLILNLNLSKLYVIFKNAIKQIVNKQLLSINYTEYKTETEYKKVIENLTAISKGCELKIYHL